MKKSYLLKCFTICVFVLAVCLCASKVWEAMADETVKDLDSYTTKLNINWSVAAQLPLTGKFTKSLTVNGNQRNVAVYIADNAVIRPYFTVVAVPDGVNTWDYLDSQGWIAQANKEGEGLFVLEPGSGGWGSAAAEASYVNAAMKFLITPVNSSSVKVFDTYGLFYFVGYGKGAAPLEAYAAQNPLNVISQAYVNGTGIGQASLDAYGEYVYTSKDQTSGRKISEVSLDAALTKCGFSRLIRKNVALPTWFNGYASNDYSLTYWGKANDCTETPKTDGVYYQKKDSQSMQTTYANETYCSDLSHGFSQVKVSNALVSADAIYSFLSYYTRYDNTMPYNNYLSPRFDFTAARVLAHYQARTQGIEETISAAAGSSNISVDLYGTSDKVLSGHGTVRVGIFAFKDDNGDGKRDPREYIMYIPKGYSGKKLPVVFDYPGHSSTASMSFDTTHLYQLADDDGFIVIHVCEGYESAVGVTHMDSNEFYYAMMAVLKQKVDGRDADIDFSRVYATGQSQGSATTQVMAKTHPEFFAAVATTSGAPSVAASSTDVYTNKPIPDCMINGQGDMSDMTPDMFSATSLQDWANYLLTANSLDKTYASYDKHEFVISRDDIYSWDNAQGIAVVKWGQTLLRAHSTAPGNV
jgi:pimeloyl-ACP methyl ester carboxylesterase